jgi:hypothetical protein
MKRLLLLPLLLCSVAAAATDDKGWISLFNGKDLTGWLHQGPITKNDSWEVRNGVMVNDLRPGKSGSNLFTDRQFRDFVLRAEFQAPEGSNSGIFLRGRHEIQITGDYSERKLGTSGNGAIWNVKAPDVYASKPSGDWQTIEVTLVGNKVTVVLNGKKIHDDVVLKTATRGALDARLNAPGPIMLQGRLGSVNFRNLQIQELAR